MRCDRAEKLIALHSTGALGRFTARRLERHLSACARCRREQEMLNRTVRLLDSLPPTLPPPNLWERVSPRLDVAPLPSPAFWRTAPFRRAFAAAAVAAALAVGVSLGIRFGLQKPAASIQLATAPGPLTSYIQTHAALAGHDAFADRAALGLYQLASASVPAGEGESVEP
jgi:anti-sigma factor RsiW